MRRETMKTLLVLLAAVPLAACVSFGAKPPPSLLTLHSDAALTPGQTQNSANAPTITVLVPVVSQALATQRVPVQSTDTSIAYIVNAQWAEPPARLFARLLSDTISAKTGHVVLSTAESFSDPGARLTGELRNFGIDAASHNAVVTYDAVLIRTTGGGVEKRRFEARVPVSAIDPDNAGTGISDAANQVADQVADWIGR
jgi:cholesterol transport system auxiliary component